MKCLVSQQNSIMADIVILIDSNGIPTTKRTHRLMNFPKHNRKKKNAQKQIESCVVPKIYAPNVLSIDNHIN